MYIQLFQRVLCSNLQFFFFTKLCRRVPFGIPVSVMCQANIFGWAKGFTKGRDILFYLFISSFGLLGEGTPTHLLKHMIRRSNSHEILFPYEQSARMPLKSKRAKDPCYGQLTDKHISEEEKYIIGFNTRTQYAEACSADSMTCFT